MGRFARFRNVYGVKTKSLKLINPTETTVSWKFRAKISSNAYKCGPLIISQETSFDYQPLEIPNAFSPNNDGVNEKLIITGLENSLNTNSRFTQGGKR